MKSLPCWRNREIFFWELNSIFMKPLLLFQCANMAASFMSENALLAL